MGIEPQNYKALSPQERRELRNRYRAEQDDNCWHCKEPLKGKPAGYIMAKPLNQRLFPAGFLRWPVHLHHDHGTGMTIGAVHAWCNGVLWQYHGE